MALLGWGTLAGDFGMRSLVGTANPQTGWGSWNWGNYSNPKVDTVIRSSLSAVDPAERENYARQAAGIALQDNAVIPMHHQIATWAMRKGLRYAARVDEFTFAQQFRAE
ncbi:extracellular solute-binding protein, family 5 [Oxalobacteraceae bacterium IMCC9480]|nr:extracellular solute-binding protein, family 5 [Oxalobacteraceae bacterium IMCC9480]